MLSVSFVQYASGFRSDLAALGRLCRDRGIDFCVDAIQGLGVFEVDVKRMQIDYLAADGHKWLVSPEGAALFYIAREKLEKIRPPSVGWKSVAGWQEYDKIDLRFREDASRFENGSFNIVGMIALGASLTLFEEVGVAEISRRVKLISDYLVDRIGEIGGTVVSPRGPGEWSGIVSFTLPDRDLRQLVRAARSEHVILSYRGGRLRASPHFYTSRGDVDRLVDVLARL